MYCLPLLLPTFISICVPLCYHSSNECVHHFISRVKRLKTENSFLTVNLPVLVLVLVLALVLVVTFFLDVLCRSTANNVHDFMLIPR
jgi:hypothetical protein